MLTDILDKIMTNSPITKNHCLDLRHLAEREIKSLLMVVATVCESFEESGYQIEINIGCVPTIICNQIEE